MSPIFYLILSMALGIFQFKFGLPVASISENSIDTPVVSVDQSLSLPEVRDETDINKPTKTLRVYIAGESIERRNRYTASPFTSTGALNDPSNNDDDQYGWMVPLADRLHLRDGSLTIQFVGASTWTSAEDGDYSGTYPSASAGRTSAISGTSVESWLDQRRAELENKTFCYDIAFASRGGNDFDVDDATYKTQLKDLIQLLAHGSSCQTNPIVYVTGHMPDSQGSATVERPKFLVRARDSVTELQNAQPSLRLRFVDLFTPFTLNQPTTAFPNPTFSNNGQPNSDIIGRNGDGLHPRRWASIYAGEIAADSLDLSELHGM